MLAPDDGDWYVKYRPQEIIDDWDYRKILCDMKDGTVKICEVVWFEDSYTWEDSDGETQYEYFTDMELHEENTGSYIDVTDVLRWTLINENEQSDNTATDTSTNT